MLRRGSELTRDDSLTVPPFEREPTPAGASGTLPLGGWTAPLSYLALDPQMVRELARAALSSPTVATLRSGEVAVGAMLVSLALRGEDVLLEELLPLSGAELRLHRYAVGQLNPIAVHPVGSLAQLLRSLAHCATSPPGETWEAVAHDGATAPVAIAAARSHELRWLQPPAADSPHAAPWAPVTTQAAAPGSAVADWAGRLSVTALPIPAAPAAPVAPARPAPPVAAAAPVPAFPGGSPVAGVDLAQLGALITAAVETALANAPLELDLDAATLDELRDTTVLERLVDAIARLDRQVGQVDAVTRQLTALTAAVDDLGDSTRSLLRHQWDNQAPAGFWTRVQRSDEEVRRAIDELAAEVRGRLRR